MAWTYVKIYLSIMLLIVNVKIAYTCKHVHTDTQTGRHKHLTSARNVETEQTDNAYYIEI